MGGMPPTLTLVLLLCSISHAVACAGGASARPRPPVGETLWLPPDADVVESALRPERVERGRNIYVDGSAWVFFEVTQPCDKLGDALAAHFSRAGWSQHTHQLRNPGMATSFARGCQVRGGGVATLEKMPGPYMEWVGQWQNARGDIVTYFIGGFSPNLRVSAEYLPAELTESRRGAPLDDQRRRYQTEQERHRGAARE